jgi:hypothetical protein
LIQVDSESFFVIVVIAAVAAVTVAVVPRRFAPPVVVVELLLGIVVGPEVLDLAETDDFIDFFSNLGLGMLFFFAGYEIDFERIRGRPLRLGHRGWLLSIGPRLRDRRPLAAAGVVLLPLHGVGDGDDGDRHADPDPARQRRAEDRVRHLPAAPGRRRVRADPAQHPGPLDRQPRCSEAAILVAFVVLRLAMALVSVALRLARLARRWSAPSRRAASLAVRITVVLVFGLVLLATSSASTCCSAASSPV